MRRAAGELFISGRGKGGARLLDAVKGLWAFPSRLKDHGSHLRYVQARDLRDLGWGEIIWNHRRAGLPKKIGAPDRLKQPGAP